MKLFRNPLGKFRERKLFERHFRLPHKVALYFILIPYALYGLVSVYQDITANGQKLWNEISHAQTITVESNDTETDGGEPNDPEADERIEITDCNSAAEYWTRELQVEGELPLIKRIITAESGNNPHAKNPNSTASSCSQFVWGTWVSQGNKYWGEEFYNKNIWNPSDSVELMVRMIRDGGLSHWSASENIWQ